MDGLQVTRMKLHTKLGQRKEMLEQDQEQWV